MTGVWLVADPVTGVIRPMEHEGDYKDGDVLVHVTVKDGRVFAQLHEQAEDEGITLKEAAQNMEIDLG